MANKILSFVLTAAMLGAIGALTYVIATPKAEKSYPEFYITDLEGNAIDYPGELKVGEEGKVMVGVTNYEKVEASYQVEVRIDGIKNNEVGPIVLADGQKWEEIISFTVDRAGNNQKVEFLLYKSEESEPYLKPVHLWINVRE